MFAEWVNWMFLLFLTLTHNQEKSGHSGHLEITFSELNDNVSKTSSEHIC